MKPAELLFWIIVGLLVATLFVFIATEIIFSLTEVDVTTLETQAHIISGVSINGF